MGATVGRIRAEMDCQPSPQDKGLVLTIKVTAYDTGLIQVNGTPINTNPNYDQGLGWMGAAEVILATMSEFRKAWVRRRQAAAQRRQPG